MSIAIIAEYNPFHNGHIFQLKKAQELFPQEEIIVIMSGKYVQRGEVAVASFEERRKFAIKHGASQVVELPFEYATQAAHIFAHGAVKMVNDLKIDKLFFGSESNSPELLIKIARAIKENKDHYNQSLKKWLKTGGNSFPRAASLALKEITGEEIILPNDILGLEYCKAIVENEYSITPYTIKRTIEFHSQETKENFASASKIRKMIFEGDQEYQKYTPMKFDQKIERIEDYYQEFQQIVRNTPSEQLAKNKMISEGMENLFKKHIGAKTMDEFINLTNSRRYTSSRIKRTILYVLLKIEKD